MSLKQKRKALNLTQADMAEKFGLTRQTYQNYENGKTEPTLDLAGKFAVFFNCSIADLFDLPETKVPLSESEKTLLSLFADLNEVGKRKLIELADDLVASGKYQKKEVPDYSVPDTAAAIA